MTDDFKEKLLKYVTGNLANETGNNIPYGIDLKIQSNTLFNELNGYTIYGQISNLSNNISILYGAYNDSGILYGFIAILDNKYNIIKIFKEYNSGTKLEIISYLNVDETGNFYGIEMVHDNLSENNRFIMLNNFTISDSNNNYNLILRKDYILPSDQTYNLRNSSFLPFGDNLISGSTITKKNNESTYIFATSVGMTHVLITKLKINVGETNVWNYYSFDITDNFYFISSYCEFSNDDFTVKFGCSIPYNSYFKYIEYISINGNALTEFDTNIDNMEFLSSNAIILNLNTTYIGGRTSGTTNNFYIYIIQNNIISILYSTTVKNIIFHLQKVSNNVFFYLSLYPLTFPNEATTIIGHINSNNLYQLENINYSVPDIHDKVLFFINTQYNLNTYYYLSNYLDKILIFNEIYNLLNYNGLSYENQESLIPNSAMLKNAIETIFARNLYNLNIDDNVTVATVEVPNNYLNNETIVNEDLISKTNTELINGTKSITKNIYETLLINFIDTLYMKNNNIPAIPKYSLNGAIKVNEAINTISEIINTKIGKLKLIYLDNTYDLITINSISIVSGQATIDMLIYAQKQLSKIQILSNDETTVYCEIDTDKAIGFHQINQKVEVI